MTQILDEWTQPVTMHEAIVMEKRIAVLLQPKPRWLPTVIWNRLLSRLLVIQER
jgi:hypothetical protein